MNKRLLIGMFIALMAMVPSSGYAFQTIDAPHFNVDSNGGSEDCTYCHFANYQPSDCIRCHANNNAPYGDSTAPLVSTHQNLDCQACHNPHVSLQATGIAGTYSGVSANTPSAGLTTLSGVTPTPEVSWVEKTGPGRGMILWIANGTNDPDNPEPASFEVEAVDAGAGTVTVKGNVSLASGNFDLRRGQLIAKKVTKTAASSYRQGDLPVQFPSQGSSSIFIDTQNGANPTGVCQVCHTATAYWKNDGSATTHNANLPCTQCHQHSSGFMVTGCTACHPGPGPDGPPTIMGEMALPPTGSQTPGMHTIHATTSGYNFPCGTCHYGTGMDRINAPDNVVKGDGIQIGFSWGKFMGYLASYNGQASVTVPYVGTNKTTVTNTGAINNGSMTCSNVYCHSDGTAVRRNCATSTLNTSLAWDGSSADPQGDTVKCNNCHGFNNGMANTMTSGKHLTHVKNLSMPCFYCHADTVQNNGSGVSVLSNKTNHVNAVYDVKGGGDWYGTPIVMDKNIASGTGTWNATTKNCTVICHNYSRNWTANDAGACPNPCTEPGAMTNIDPIVSWTVVNLDNNSLSVVDTSLNPDHVDPVKAQCQGGGYSASAPGLTKFSHPDTLMGNYVAVTPMGGSANPAAPVVRTYRTSAVDATTDPNVPRLWFNYRAIDNGPQSWNNSFVVGTVDGDGFNDSGWNSHIIQAVDLTKVNIQPNLDFSVSAVRTGANTCTLTITDKTIDLDYNDPAKNILFGGGHDGTAGRGRLMFNTPSAGVDSGAQPITFTNVPSNTTISTTANGASGATVWYQYFVFDNHYVNTTSRAASPSYQIYSGWKSIILP